MTQSQVIEYIKKKQSIEDILYTDIKLFTKNVQKEFLQIFNKYWNIYIKGWTKDEENWPKFVIAMQINGEMLDLYELSKKINIKLIKSLNNKIKYIYNYYENSN